jgi:hypothetical protein
MGDKLRMTDSVGIAVAGTGAWGADLVRSLASRRGSRLVAAQASLEPGSAPVGPAIAGQEAS